MAHILLRHRDIPDINTIDVYKKNGGFDAFKNAVTKMKPIEVTDVVKNSGLRGRGGAGFPTGMKWSFIDNKNWPHYVVANADESEPGTFKDREIMEGNPFQFLEGVAIASYAVGANVAYVYLRGEFWQLAAFLDEKIAEMEKAGYLGEKPLRHGILAAHLHPPRCGRLYLRRRDRNARIARRQTRTAARPSAVPAFVRSYMASRPSSTTSRPLPTSRSSCRTARTGTSHGHADSAGVKIFSLSGTRAQTRQLRTALRHNLP
jgi:NADH-quinone oxidoreductase subunit F